MGRLRKNVENEQKLFLDERYFINKPFLYKGLWNEVIFKNNNPIEIEIGTGKGKFIFEKAKNNPDINFIAIDKFPTVLYKLLKKLDGLEKPISNIKILSFDVNKIEDIFEENEISKIYLNFSDPWPKNHHEKFRLTSNFYTSKFLKVLKPNGLIEFKTDNANLFNYTLNKVRENNFYLTLATNDLYNTQYKKGNIQTEYEQKWIARGAKIKKIIICNKK